MCAAPPCNKAALAAGVPAACASSMRRMRHACWQQCFVRGTRTARDKLPHQRGLWSARPACAVHLPRSQPPCQKAYNRSGHGCEGKVHR